MHQAGEFQGAQDLYLRILKRDSSAVDAHHYLGILLSQHGEVQRALTHLRRAVRLRSDVSAFHNNLGGALEASGALEPAVDAYREAMRLEPEDADAHFNLALVLSRIERWSEAKESLGAAIALQADDADYHLNLGKVLTALNQPDAALQAFEEAARLEPGLYQAHLHRGNLLYVTRQYPDATAAYRTAESLRPFDAALQINLGNTLRESGDLAGAAARFERALAIDPRSTAALIRLGRIERDGGKLLAAANWFRQASDIEPLSTTARDGLIAVLAPQRPARHEAQLEVDLLACFESADGDVQQLARLAANQLRHKHGLDAWDGACSSAGELFERVHRDPLLIAFLRTVINVDPILERVLAGLRRWLVSISGAQLGCGDPVLMFLAAFAEQCFANEYVYDRNAQEQGQLSALVARLDKCALDGDLEQSAFEFDLLRCALYAQPSTLSIAEELLGRTRNRWRPATRDALERILHSPLEERRMVADIPSLTVISDAVSRAVRDQYEHHPYPRWLRMPSVRARPLFELLRQRFPHAEFGPPRDGPLRVLVPGCGTGYEAVDAALCYSNSEILAVDLSRASLAYAQRMAKVLGIESIAFKQADILELDVLCEQFTLVSCSGVLHHMGDPERGWAVLERRLEPGGVMRIGLYSEIARAAIVRARELIEASGLEPVEPDIRAFRQRILNQNDDPLLGELKNSDDLYTTSACRDLLFHVQEQRFTLPRIGRILSDLGLEFLGFELPGGGIRSRYLAMFPDDETMTSLASWHAFERQHPSCFVAMYQFWCRKPA